jgi:hypothetical protein
MHAAAVVMLVAAAAPSLAGAQGGEGAFVGAAVGQNHGETWVFGSPEDNYPQFTVELGEPAWRLFGGYRWRYVGVEGGFRDLGTTEDTIDGVPVRATVKGWDVFAVGIVPLHRFEVSGKLGKYFYDLERSDGGSPSGTATLDLESVVAGVGVAVRWQSVSVRLEWERGVDESTVLSAVSLGVVLHFGRR